MTETPAPRDPDPQAGTDRPSPDDDSFPLSSLVSATLGPLDDEWSPATSGAPEFPDKTGADLEWDKVREEVAHYAVTPEGEELVPQLPPLPGEGAVERRLHEVREAMELIREDQRPPLRGMYDIREAIAHVQKDGTLVAEDLQAVGRTCDVASRCKRFLENRADRFPFLASVAEDLHGCEELRNALEDAIEPGGRLRDDASPELQRLRRAVQNQHDRLKARIDELLRSRDLEEHLQDDFYTIRDNRYVIPIRVGAKSQVPGIVHGYSSSGKTAFIEPRELVEINNELRWAEIDLEEEKQRILERLSRLVANRADKLDVNADLLAYLDVVVAAAAFGVEAIDGSIPSISDRRLALTDIRHPLLWLQNEEEVDGETVNETVTNDVHIDPDKRVLVVSGPNTGGKTVLLKAMGLSALMARAGLPVPAEPGSEIPLYEEVFTDIGDEQSIERDLSTFSAHLTNINGFLDDCGPESLVLLDELFTGTDPLEGAALATALLEDLSDRESTGVVTTHLEGLKTLALQDDTFANASMGFDLEDLEPTFQLTMGVPGSSFAIRIANRLGFPGHLVDRAEEVVEGEDHHGIDEVIESLEDRMSDVRQERQRMEEARREARKTEEKYREKYEDLLEREREMVHDETRELKEELVDVREEIREKISRLKQVGRVEQGDEIDESELQEMQEDLKEAEETIEEASNRSRPPDPGPAGLASVPLDELEEGMEVYVHSYERSGSVVTVYEEDEEVQVQLGALKVTVSLDEVYYPSEDERRSHIRGRDRNTSSADQNQTSGTGTGGALDFPRTEGNTLDLRGLRTDEAVDRLEDFLDDKYLDRFDGVFVIHGHGTGALRRAVRAHVQESPYVDDFRRGEQEEGGDGVTVIGFVDEIER